MFFAVEPGPYPEESRPDAFELLSQPLPDYVPPGVTFGDVIEDVMDTYAPGDVANVTFYGANPRHNVKVRKFKSCIYGDFY